MFNKEAFHDRLQTLADRHHQYSEDKSRHIAQQHDSKVRESMTLVIMGMLDDTPSTDETPTPDDTTSTRQELKAHIIRMRNQARQDYNGAPTPTLESEAAGRVQALSDVLDAFDLPQHKVPATPSTKETPRTPRSTSTRTRTNQKHFDAWLESADVTRAYFAAFVDEAGYGSAIDFVQEKLVKPQPVATHSTAELSPLEEALRATSTSSTSPSGSRLPELPVTTLTTAYKEATRAITSNQRNALDLVTLQDKIARTIIVADELAHARYAATQIMSTEMQRRHPSVTATSNPDTLTTRPKSAIKDNPQA